jgi:DNA-binding helix-hairpin-helix protein with protein kinase domain
MNFRRASNNAAVRLGKELGRGGEGAVFLVDGATDLVAKVYLKPPSQARIDKLRSMARGASPDLLKVAAWPMDLLLDGGSQPRGFLMPRVNGREDLHQLYTPRSRRRTFPSADFRFLVRVAANLARAMAQIHARGHVIGDVNHGNALVGHDGTVRLIDCDSIQIRDGGRVFTCDVGVPLFTPAELSGRAFRGLRRQAYHDAFGLAALIFHLLYLGRHPFAGQFAHGDMPIERAIAEGRVAYGGTAALMGMRPPPGTLALGAFGGEVEQLFEMAFAGAASSRPTAERWVTALRELENSLVVCRADVTHHHPVDQPCCWCPYEKHWNTRVFARQLTGYVAAGVPKVARLWDAITAIEKPAKAEPLEMPPPGRHYTAAEKVGRRLQELFRGAEWNAWQEWLDRAHERVRRQTEKWNLATVDDRFEETYRELEGIKDRLLELPKERAKGIEALKFNLEDRWRDVWLAQFRIDQAKLPRVTPMDIAMLASHGIDSADDVLRNIGNLPGLLHPDGAGHVRAWARERQRQFQFESASGMEQSVVQHIDDTLADEQERLMGALAKGASRLRALSADIRAERQELWKQLNDARVQLRLAERNNMPR